jgi:transposase InsO family protein
MEGIYSKDLQEWCLKRHIAHCFSAPHAPKSNGRAENSNLHLGTLTRTLMSDMSLPADLWPDVVDMKQHICSTEARGAFKIK